MDFLPFSLRNHPPSEGLKIGSYQAVLGEDLDTPLGFMTGLILELPRSLPNILLLPNKQSEFYVSQNFTIKSGQRLTLEGDFNKFFQVYSIPGYEVFALEVLSPEFMQSLIDIDDKFIVTFALNNVYILLQETQSLTAQKKDEIIKAAGNLAGNIELKLRSWSETDAEAASRQMLDWTSTPSVRLKGKQINYRIYAGLVAALVLIFIVWWTDLVTNKGQKGSPDIKGDLLWSVAFLILVPIFTYIGRRKY